MDNQIKTRERSRKYAFTVLFLILSCCGKGQNEFPIITSFAAVDSLQLVAPRPMVIFLHTDWCRYCQHMQQTTFRDPAVKALLNNHFYFLALDAETEATIAFGNHSFPFQPHGNGNGVNSLAAAIGTMDGVLQLPTLVIMNEAYEIIFQYGAFLSAEALVTVLAASAE
jgi:thioredoxin-related protein